MAWSHVAWALFGIRLQVNSKCLFASIACVYVCVCWVVSCCDALRCSVVLCCIVLSCCIMGFWDSSIFAKPAFTPDYNGQITMASWLHGQNRRNDEKVCVCVICIKTLSLKSLLLVGAFAFVHFHHVATKASLLDVLGLLMPRRKVQRADRKHKRGPDRQKPDIIKTQRRGDFDP